jgi:hypothetical protein
MQADTQQGIGVKIMWWAGWALTLLVVVGLSFSAYGKLNVEDDTLKKEFARLGWNTDVAKTLAIAEFGSVVLFAFPPTSVLGAIMLTGYAGGAVATHVRVGDSTWWIPVLIGVFAWLALFLRDGRIRALVPWRW